MELMTKQKKKKHEIKRFYSFFYGLHFVHITFCCGKSLFYVAFLNLPLVAPAEKPNTGPGHKATTSILFLNLVSM